MTARGYEQDEALRALKERVRRLELKEARNRPASGVSVSDPGGFFGGPGGLTVEQVMALIGAGTAPTGFLRTVLGGVGDVQPLGTLGAGPVIIDLANGNKFWGTADQNVTISTTGWTNLKDCQISVEILQDGSGGSTPTFSGVTWIGGTPTWDTTASSVTHVVLFSRDGGTTIYGAIVGAGGGSSGSFLEVINGGGGTVQAHGNLGSTETIDTANGNYHWGTLNANCTFTFTTTVDTAERWFTLELIEDGTGGWTITVPGSVVWLGGSTPTHDTTAGSTTIYAFFTRNGGTSWIGGQLGGGSGSSDLDAIIAASSGQDIADALAGADSPDAANVFATMADVAGAVGSGAELDYGSQTSDVAISATSEATATTLVSGNAIAYDGTPVVIEFSCTGITPGVSAADRDVRIYLYDGSSSIGWIGYIQAGVSNSESPYRPVTRTVRITPSAATHTYSIRASRNGSDGNMQAGAGGSGNMMPAHIRVTKA